jgi:hypothetical protein
MFRVVGALPMPLACAGNLAGTTLITDEMIGPCVTTSERSWGSFVGSNTAERFPIKQNITSRYLAPR